MIVLYTLNLPAYYICNTRELIVLDLRKMEWYGAISTGRLLKFYLFPQKKNAVLVPIIHSVGCRALGSPFSNVASVINKSCVRQ